MIPPHYHPSPFHYHIHDRWLILPASHIPTPSSTLFTMTIADDTDVRPWVWSSPRSWLYHGPSAQRDICTNLNPRHTNEIVNEFKNNKTTNNMSTSTSPITVYHKVEFHPRFMHFMSSVSTKSGSFTSTSKDTGNELHKTDLSREGMMWLPWLGNIRYCLWGYVERDIL